MRIEPAIEIVCQVSWDDVLSRKRDMPIVDARSLYAHQRRKDGLSLSEIGSRLHRNHSTVLSLLNRHDALMRYAPYREKSAMLEFLLPKPDDYLLRFETDLERYGVQITVDQKEMLELSRFLKSKDAMGPENLDDVAVSLAKKRVVDTICENFRNDCDKFIDFKEWTGEDGEVVLTGTLILDALKELDYGKYAKSGA